MKAEDYRELYSLEESLWWFRGMREITAALLDPLLSRPKQPRRVLDAGCGTGGNLKWLERYSGNTGVTGIDFNSHAITLCRAREHPRLAQASVVNLPFADSIFDFVTSFDVLIQLPGDEDVLALNEMQRVLRPGGIIFIRVAAYEWMFSGHDRALNTQRRYSLSALIQKSERAGFLPIRYTYANSLLLPVAAVRRLLLRRISRTTGSDVRPLPRSLRWLDKAMAANLHTEAMWLKRSRAKFPAGLSAIFIGQKPRS